MVSGLTTSPNDQERISSGEARRTWMYSKSAARWSRVLGKSIIYWFLPVPSADVVASTLRALSFDASLGG